jgi:2-polyprenyl-3-methyl-5-hydroxy-6-metoxy-1,4-benzoquinol methylase
VDPVELTILLKENGIEVNNAIGISYNVLKGDFENSDDLGVNYIMSGIKKVD